MSVRWIPDEEFRSLTTVTKLKVVLGWALGSFLLLLGIGGNLGLGIGLVLGVLFATLGAFLWISSLA